MFSLYIACNEQTLNFGYASLQKYFSNIQWHKEKTYEHLFILSNLLWYNQNQSNTVNKQCSLDLEVAHYVYLDIPQIFVKLFITQTFRVTLSSYKIFTAVINDFCLISLQTPIFNYKIKILILWKVLRKYRLYFNTIETTTDTWNIKQAMVLPVQKK